MGRLADIEEIVAGTLNDYMNLKMVVRGRPRYLDPQMDRGKTRFGIRRGSQFTALLPDNKYLLAETAFKSSTRIVMESRPTWFQIGCLVRIGPAEDVGELHTVQDLVSNLELELAEDLLATYEVSDTQDPLNYVSLIGTPGSFFAVAASPLERQVLFVEAWHEMVPGDIILVSPTPDIFDSLAEFETIRTTFINTRPGIGEEPATVYQYEIEIKTDSGLLPFTPTSGLKMFLKAQPLFLRGGFAQGDIKLPVNTGPCLLDAFSGGLLINQKVETRLGLKTFDAFGNQLNASLTDGQEWQPIPTNYLILERSIRSDTFLFWQRLSGNFQYLKTGYFQAELDENGEFAMSSDILVPAWPSDRQHGWVVPIVPQSPVRVTVQFEPQDRQIYDLPSNQTSFIRPKLLVDPLKRPILRVVVAIKGSPNSRVEIRDWTYDGSEVLAVSYFMLGAQAAFGNNRWLAGGFCVKPLFFNLDVLRGHYSDNVTKYNSGYLYL